MRNSEETKPDASLPASVRTVAELGKIAQAVRKRQGLTQLDVSALSGLGIRFLVDFEKGKQTIQMQKALDVLSQLGLEVVIRKRGSQ